MEDEHSVFKYFAELDDYGERLIYSVKALNNAFRHWTDLKCWLIYIFSFECYLYMTFIRNVHELLLSFYSHFYLTSPASFARLWNMEFLLLRRAEGVSYSITAPASITNTLKMYGCNSYSLSLSLYIYIYGFHCDIILCIS